MNYIENFGSKVFTNKVMRGYLPQDVCDNLQRTSLQGHKLDPSMADQVADAMKQWAMEQGATHYTHWFQPMTNITAGKLDSFLTPTKDGTAIAEFSPKALIMGEPDASSFPSGGLRATFEARGYTAWDPTSPAFVREDTLYIPTAFCTYTGLAMDAKTPLLRSMEAVSVQGVRLMHLLGYTDVQQVAPAVGAEQEYFLIDRARYEQRLDLKLCGRTVLGAKPPKGQELDDHYCGRIRIKVADFMRAVDKELWSLGVAAKTKHNEAAPAQHELAPVYCTANIAADHNQLTMEVLRIVAKKHGLACLLHEKPFEGINGSGKHNNYSLTTDTGINLLKPGEEPGSNPLFLATLCAILTAVDNYADLLRMSASCAGNDFRLGACEAPPAIISVFLGERLTTLLEDIASGTLAKHHKAEALHIGVSALPELIKDDSDRNRTSPFAFTGGKFEFRMVGSSQSISMCNVVLNTAIAQVLDGFCHKLEKAKDKTAAVHQIVAQTIKEHRRIIFNGNNYSDKWVEEAKKRGLPILNSSVDAFAAMVAPKNRQLFEQFAVFSETECYSRYEIMLQNYSNVVAIEAATMLEMVRRQVLPCALLYTGDIADACTKMQNAGLSIPSPGQHLNTLGSLLEEIQVGLQNLEEVLEAVRCIANETQKSTYYNQEVRIAMARLRTSCDRLESIMDAARWPMPTYTDLLHRV